MDYLSAALKIAPLVIEAGGDAYAFVKSAIAVYEKDTGPTDADWSALHDAEKRLRDKMTAS